MTQERRTVLSRGDGICLVLWVFNFIYFLSLAARGLPLPGTGLLGAARGGSSSLWVRASLGAGASHSRAPALWARSPQQLWPVGSAAVATGFPGSKAGGIFPGPGVEAVSPALAGGFLSTVPLREVLSCALIKLRWLLSSDGTA